MKKCCDFCNKDATAKISLNNWHFDTCDDWNCKRKLHLIFHILMNILSDETIVQMVRCIPKEELNKK